MKSFRTEIENPVVERDIIDLDRKIQLYNDGKIDEDGFRSLRLARGIYGQRQTGVQMIRIKLPFGKVSSEQLHRIADVSDEYSNGKLHITTRQDIQIHYVSLDRTPELWAELEKNDITLREACGNAVRNITASETAGIDIREPFDVSPYAEAVFKFFLRNPICQEMGRKFKISFSATDKDDAMSFIHDIGFIAKIKRVNNKDKKGFKVLLSGGLGAQPKHADIVHEFLEADKIIPFIESTLRVFDRYGERSKRAKARLKHLIQKIGLSQFLNLIKEEKQALSYSIFPISFELTEFTGPKPFIASPEIIIENNATYDLWKKTNVIEQKQDGFYAIGIKVRLGDLQSNQARSLADLIKNYAGNEIRLTIKQGILIRHVKKDLLPLFYLKLKDIEFADPGYNSTNDITACPGTDTCNLGIASSTGLAKILESVLIKEFPNYINNKDLSIKISGCMNACGQHSIANIGFYGMSVKNDKLALPAIQVLLGGGILGDGKGRFSDKIIKIPSKRGPDALRTILYDFELNAEKNETFNKYYDGKGKTYFYHLLKPLSNLSNIIEDDYIDWGHNKSYIKAIGIGECAGVVIDLVTTLLFESEEKLENAKTAFELKKWADSIYYSYTSMINTAKAVLIGENIKTNSQESIIKGFDSYFVETGIIDLNYSFSSLIYKIKENNPSEIFALNYLDQAKDFYSKIDELRLKAVSDE